MSSATPSASKALQALFRATACRGVPSSLEYFGPYEQLPSGPPFIGPKRLAFCQLSRQGKMLHMSSALLSLDGEAAPRLDGSCRSTQDAAIKIAMQDGRDSCPPHAKPSCLVVGALSRTYVGIPTWIPKPPALRVLWKRTTIMCLSSRTQSVSPRTHGMVADREAAKACTGNAHACKALSMQSCLRTSDDLGSAMHLVECKGRCQSSVSSSDYYHFSSWEAIGSLRHLCKEG